MVVTRPSERSSRRCSSRSTAHRLSLMQGSLAVTGDPEAARLLNTNALALLLGMLLDQQVPMEWAFFGPYLLQERMGGRLDAHAIASMPQDEFLAVCRGPRAIHRFHSSMGKRVQAVCQVIVDEY